MKQFSAGVHQTYPLCWRLVFLSCIGFTFRSTQVIAQPGSIFGGQPINISQAPYQTSIESGDDHFCGGSIINAEWVLTAGHCVVNKTAGELIVHVGATDQTDNFIGQRVEVDMIILHPNYLPGALVNDMALLHLATPLCFNENVQPVVYATPANTTLADLQPGTPAFISGWGDSGNLCCNAILQGASIPIISNADASIMIADPNNGCTSNNLVGSNMIAFYQDGISAGSGDSGGPAVISGPNGIPVLIGVTSWGGCPYDLFPSIYANVRELSDFITNTITQVSSPCVCPDFITHINVNTVFDDDMEMPGDIIVHSGAELLIQANIGMRQGTRILVERNARLSMNYGKLTRGCNGTIWEGIQVLGNHQKAQPEHFAPLTDPDQAGIVWLKHGTIEWARCGVTAGDGNGQEFGGGVVWTDHATFQNNRKDVEFMKYKFAFNKSRFFNTTFTEIGNTFSNTEGVTILETDGIEFQNCTFSNLDFEGIRTYDASIKVLNNNQFIDNETGISSYATYPMTNKLEVGLATGIENQFNNNRFHINASLTTGYFGTLSNGKFALDIINNNFLGGEYGVIVDGPSNFRLAGNLLTDVQFGARAANTGYNSLSNQNFIGCNKFSQGSNGIFAIGDNREMQFLYNEFATNSGGSDFLLFPSFYPPINGSVRATQGQLNGFAGNCFSDPGMQVDILTPFGTNPFTYFFDGNPIPANCDPGEPEPVTPGNYSTQDVEVNLNTLDCDQFGGLPAGFSNPTPGDLNTRRATLQQLAPIMATDAVARDQYYRTLQEKEAILRYLLGQAIEAGQFATAEGLLTAEQSKAADWAIFGLRMDRKEYTGAATWLNQLPIQNDEDTKFREIQLINILRLQSPATFLLSEAQESYLSTVAESTSPVRGFARGILGLMKDRRFYPDEIDLGEERSNLIKLRPPDRKTAHKIWIEKACHGKSVE